MPFSKVTAVQVGSLITLLVALFLFLFPVSPIHADPEGTPTVQPTFGGPETGGGTGPSTGGGTGPATAGGTGPSTGGGTGPSTGGGAGGVTNPLSFKTLQAFFEALLKFLAMLAVPFIVFMIILTGFKFVTAQGKPAELETARKMLLYTLIGGMLILGASIIASVIKGTVDSIGMVDHLLQVAAPLLNF